MRDYCIVLEQSIAMAWKSKNLASHLTLICVIGLIVEVMISIRDTPSCGYVDMYEVSLNYLQRIRSYDLDKRRFVGV